MRELALLVVAIAASAYGVAACKTRTTQEASADAGPPLNGWQQVMAGIKADGTVPRETALRAFAFTYGPIPGVTTPPPDDSAPQCGALLPAWLAPYAKTLDRAQRQAVLDGYLGTRRGAAVRNQLGGGGPQAVDAAAWSAGTAQWIDWLNEQARISTYTPTAAEMSFFNGAVAEAKRLIEPHSPVGTPFTVSPIFRSATMPTGGHTLAEAFLTPSANESLTGAERTCHVRVFNAVFSQPNRVEARAAVIHEVFHCYQFANFNGSWGDWTDLLNGRPWWMEGAAAWVGESAVGGAQGYYQHNWMPIYLRGNSNGNYDLFANSYDAIGAFDHLNTAGIPVLARLLPMVRRVTDPARFDFLIDGDVSKLKALASGAAREPSWGAAWEFPGPLGRGVEGRRRWGVVDPAVGIVARPAQQWTYRVPVATSDDLVLVRGSGAGTLAVAGRTVAEFVPRIDKVFCFRGECRCPNAQSPFGLPPQRVQGESVEIGVVGLPSSGAQLVVRPMRLADACDQPDAGVDAGPPLETGTLDRCLAGTWRLDTADARVRYQEAVRQGNMEIVGIRGGQSMTVAAAGARGTFAHQMLPMVVLAKGPPGSSIEMAIEFTGTSSGAVRTAHSGSGSGSSCDTRGLVTFDRTTGAIQATARVRVGAASATQTQNPLEGAQLGGTAEYRVQGDRLTMTPKVAGGIASVYTR